MGRERIVWVIALVAVGAMGYFGGQALGVRQGLELRTQAASQFMSERGANGAAGAQGAAAAPGAAGSQAGAPGGFGGGRGGMMGTVSAVSGDAVTISTRDGQTVTVKLAADGTVRRQVDGTLADIKQGDTIVAAGQQSGDVFEATSIQIGGFGGTRPGSAAAPAAP